MHKIFLILLFTLSSYTVLAQASSSLNEPISVSYKNTKIEAVLANLESKAGIRFSYNPTIFTNFGPVNYSANNQALKIVLMEILDGGISFKTRGNHIILQKKNAEERDFLVMGYITNELTSERIFNASIYEANTLTSTLSDRYGYYKIRLRRDLPNIDLKIQKVNFISETVKVPFRKDGKINVALAEKSVLKPTVIAPLESKKIKADSTKPAKLDSLVQIKPIENEVLASQTASVQSKPFENLGSSVKVKSEQFMDWLMSTTQKIHFNNISDSISRPFQISMLPFIGTNGRMSSTISNDFSINIISGVAKSINKFEAGGFLNLVRENMTGIQMAGFGNVVGKKQTGLQLAGFSNVNFGSSEGVLASGFANLTFGKSSGVQLAGFSNHNFSDSRGVLMAGFGNFNTKNYKGLQVSGFINVNADTLNGSQISTFNFANKMKNGVQIGFFNYAHDAENVLPIGFFSYVHKGGYRRLELATNDLGLAEISFKTGVRAFYNIFSAQYNTRNNSLPQFSFGYGVGSGLKVTKRMALDFNLIYSQFVTENWNPEGWNNQMTTANINLELKLSNRFALFGGPSYNWYTTTDNSFDISSLKLANARSKTTTWWGAEQNLYSWMGFKAGIRFCN